MRQASSWDQDTPVLQVMVFALCRGRRLIDGSRWVAAAKRELIAKVLEQASQ